MTANTALDCPEQVLRVLAQLATVKPSTPGSPGHAIVWAVHELDRLRGLEVQYSEVMARRERDRDAANAENARLRRVLESRIPDRDQWEHAAELLHRWVSDVDWCSATDSAKRRSRTRVAQLAVELGVIDA